MLVNTSKNGILTYRILHDKIVTMALTIDTTAWGDVRDHDPTPALEETRHQDEANLPKLKHDIDGLRKVLEDMKAHRVLLKLDMSFPRIGEKLENIHAQAIFELEQDIDFYELVIEDIMNDYRKIYNRLYIEPLREHMDELYKKQKEHYEVQKQRFEECKQKYGRNHTDFFPKADQDFISKHRAANEACRREWSVLHEQCEMLTQLMEEIDC